MLNPWCAVPVLYIEKHSVERCKSNQHLYIKICIIDFCLAALSNFKANNHTLGGDMNTFSAINSAFMGGGTWMWVILALQIVATAIIIERMVFLFRKRKITELNHVKTYEEKIRKGELQEVIKMAEADSATHPVARAVKAGATAAMNFGGKDEIQGKMDEVLLKETEIIEQRTPFLAMLANVGTLTGLLGTIVGMIKSFSAITNANPMEKATLLSTGISEAMNTTAYGLIMAIPTLIFFAILMNRSKRLTDDLHQSALKVYNWLSYAYEPIPVRNVKSKRPQEQFADM